MGVSMAKITRIKARDDDSTKKIEKKSDQPAEEAEVVRKVSVKAKNSDNTKLESAKKARSKKELKAEKKLARQEARKNRKVPTVLKPLYWLLTPFRALGHYIHESFVEVRQVRWPNRKETWKLTFSVIIYVVIIGGIIMLLDALLTFISNKILGGM